MSTMPPSRVRSQRKKDLQVKAPRPDSPLLIIGRWNEVRSRLTSAGEMFSHCPHDMDFVSSFLLKLYAIGFHHGAMSASDAEPMIRRLILKTSKKSGHPVEILEEAMQTLVAEMVSVHRPKTPPEQRN